MIGIFVAYLYKETKVVNKELDEFRIKVFSAHGLYISKNIVQGPLLFVRVFSAATRPKIWISSALSARG